MKLGLEFTKILKQRSKLINFIFYIFFGLASSLALFLFFYWSLRVDSSIVSLISNTSSQPVYFWTYLLLTFGSIILFGVNAALLSYRWKKFGSPKLGSHVGSGLGSFVGIVASACPVCGSWFLAALGIVGGLAVFPLQGLELKALSFGLMSVSLWLTVRELNSLSSTDKMCLVSHNNSFKLNDFNWLLGSFALTVIFSVIGWEMIKTEPLVFQFASDLLKPIGVNLKYSSDTVLVDTSDNNEKIYNELFAKIFPDKGFQSKIALEDSIVKLEKSGVIDKDKFESLYKDRGGFPTELKDILIEPSHKPILLTNQNVNFYINLLWPLGLSNYMTTNKKGLAVSKSLFNFASTASWNLGKEDNGGIYFNRFKILSLTSEQETLITNTAKNIYRPCCNNSTFFQDCNHGSALLGLLQLGASQGLTERDLYKEALAFNSFWFPDNYVQTALYFKVVKNIDWENIDPKVILSKDYSSNIGWAKNVQSKMTRIPKVNNTQCSL